ncbi:MAG TPA: lysophospholipid acyltransferase family protein, partial [Bacteroidales bacterium]|nr:lysophospholipid acyltransferase family protein [Bacteroidales bacterium]
LLFNLLGLIHPRLRTARLPSELLNKKEFHVGIRIGKPINNEELQEFKDISTLMRFLRAKTYALGSSFEVKKNYFASPLRAKINPEPIIEPVEQQVLEEEINRIRVDNLVITFNQYELYFCYSTAIPNTIREIGRLREITFREVGEGTNRAIDIDEFDLYYHHLFIWDTTEKRIIGAYRLGKGADLFQKFGVKGFYINTLFHISSRFFPILKQSIELGRSFIVKDYQQKVFVLYLLWRGILTFMRNNPEYRYLIGPVSISNNFLKVSKSILVHFIKKHYWDAEMASMVRQRKPFKVRLSSIDAEILLERNQNSSLKGIDDIISELEPQSFKVPILLKKYLKQNARIIAFNIDPKFNNALDGFIVMDFQSIPEDTLQMLEKQNS